MKHLKPYNKIYSMMCGVVVFRCVSVYSCTRVFVSCGIIVCVIVTCLKDVSKYAATFIMFFADFFHNFFCLFLFQTDTFSQRVKD